MLKGHPRGEMKGNVNCDTTTHRILIDNKDNRKIYSYQITRIRLKIDRFTEEILPSVSFSKAIEKKAFPIGIPQMSGILAWPISTDFNYLNPKDKRLRKKEDTALFVMS